MCIQSDLDDLCMRGIQKDYNRLFKTMKKYYTVVKPTIGAVHIDSGCKPAASRRDVDYTKSERICTMYASQSTSNWLVESYHVLRNPRVPRDQRICTRCLPAARVGNDKHSVFECMELQHIIRDKYAMVVRGVLTKFFGKTHPSVTSQHGFVHRSFIGCISFATWCSHATM